MEGFLNSGDDTLLLVGEAGSGKSMFSRWYAKQLLDRLKAVLGWTSAEEEDTSPMTHGARSSVKALDSSGGGTVGHVTMWVPYLVELKEYSAPQLKDVLPRWSCVHLTASHCTTQHHTLHHNAPHCTTLCITLHHNPPHSTVTVSTHHTAPHRTASHYITLCTTLHHSAPHSTTLHHNASL